MFLSLLPISAVMPHDRNLLFVGLGTMPLLAQWISWISQKDWSKKLPLFRFASRFLVIGFITIHGVIAPITLPLAIPVPAKFQESITRASESLPSDQEIKKQQFMLVNPPNYLFFGSYVSNYREVNGMFNPIKCLTSGGSPLTLKRVNSHAIEFKAESRDLVHPGDRIFRTNKFRMHSGQKVELDDMTVEVLEVRDGIPSAVRFNFSAPLEDSSFAWFRWSNGIYIPFILPVIGEKVTIEGSTFTIG
jgi:hypothetical protein